MFKGLYFCGCISEEKISSRRNHCACSDRRHREIELRSTPKNGLKSKPAVSNILYRFENTKTWKEVFNIVELRGFMYTKRHQWSFNIN